MTIRQLIDALETIEEQTGRNAAVVVLDTEGEWPFSLHIERTIFGHPPELMVTLDITGTPDHISFNLPE